MGLAGNREGTKLKISALQGALSPKSTERYQHVVIVCFVPSSLIISPYVLYSAEAVNYPKLYTTFPKSQTMRLANVHQPTAKDHLLGNPSL